LSFAGVTFQGRLRIIDRQRFLQALAQGVGPGKAYGFGLFSIAPA
jgi:CRISPR system Cascade subunit CasE